MPGGQLLGSLWESVCIVSLFMLLAKVSPPFQHQVQHEQNKDGAHDHVERLALLRLLHYLHSQHVNPQ